jgi:hypothetical protein
MRAALWGGASVTGIVHSTGAKGRGQREEGIEALFGV